MQMPILSQVTEVATTITTITTTTTVSYSGMHEVLPHLWTRRHSFWRPQLTAVVVAEPKYVRTPLRLLAINPDTSPMFKNLSNALSVKYRFDRLETAPDHEWPRMK